MTEDNGNNHHEDLAQRYEQTRRRGQQINLALFVQLIGYDLDDSASLRELRDDIAFAKAERGKRKALAPGRITFWYSLAVAILSIVGTAVGTWVTNKFK